ncbi:hypothetical protein AMS68_001804 [Peltaster fructicola]|uniref:Auxin efflux carrier n=1 Tax=Peltaster fructicola TaxID=286661 RepID=A0A6H0XNF4_9PEZI|nr:hypothetical protein AMS68_001804 [Peltaster fructicola]
MFDAHSQKFVAELNTMVFTPCLIFTKLASQLNADKLAELAVIPVLFVIQTIVSWIAAQLMARVFGFGRKKRQKNFILAMGVFGNSNSLPISLVISLSKTISGLHWDRVPGDNDNEVAARGILYLLIFQQLGQLLRWTWGYSVLLKPAAAYEEDEQRIAGESGGSIEEGPYRDEPDPDDDLPKPSDSGFSSSPSSISGSEQDEPLIGATPANGNNISTSPRHLSPASKKREPLQSRPSVGHITQFPDFSVTAGTIESVQSNSLKHRYYVAKARTYHFFARCNGYISARAKKLFASLPPRLQKFLSTFWYYFAAFMRGVWRQMNPPLWAMLAALIVASIPALQSLFFSKGTFVNNSITRAVSQTGNVAVPLILVVLGANLARNALPKEQLASTPEEKAEERRLLYASLLSRMVIPTVIMAPILAVFAKFVPISILDDPIFVIVAFLLTGAPSALQLAQICQMNEVFMGAMSSLLVASYVVAILPSTLILVLLALEVVEWAS